MANTALYYPHIGFTNPALVKAMALFYESIFRIVPDGLIPEDAPELQPLLEDGSIGIMIDPIPFSQRASEKFLEKADSWLAAALSHTDDDEGKIARLHSDKIDDRVRRLFREAGYAGEHDWFNVPTELASNFMLYLASEIASSNQLELVTADWGAWTGTSYFGLDGEVDEFLQPLGADTEIPDDSFGLFGLFLDELVPLNIAEIPAAEIARFREIRRDEMNALRTYLDALRDELAQLDSVEVSEERIRAKVRDLSTAISDFKRSAGLLKVKGWFGVSMMGIPATAFLGKLFAIPSASTVSLGVAGLAIGSLFNISSTREKLLELRPSSPASALVDIQKTFKDYTRQRGGGDMNFHAYNCMEEYVND